MWAIAQHAVGTGTLLMVFAAFWSSPAIIGRIHVCPCTTRDNNTLTRLM
jgi:hypothetical protein